MQLNTALIDQLAATSWRDGNGNTPQTISFGITTNGDFASGYGEQAGYSQLTSAQAIAARTAIQAWDDLIAPDFVEYTSSAPGSTDYVNGADIKFSQSSTNVNYAHAYFPTTTGDESYSYARMSGSVWLRAGHSQLANPSVGTYGYQTFMHEVGHTLGLNHAGNYNGGAPQYGNTSTGWLYAEDSWQFTIMSYFNAANTGGNWGGARAQTPMVYDIYAIQSLYGAETTTRAGNDVYGFGRNDGDLVYDFAVNGSPIVTIWDAGGRDTVNLSGFTRGQRLDLAKGAYSDVGNGYTNNFAIAIGAVIEDAVGSDFNDTIDGNAVANLLQGLDGADILRGHDGNDTLDGGDGDDFLYGGAGDDIVRGGNGYDIVTIATNFASITVTEVAGGYQILGEGLDFVADDVEAYQFDDELVDAADLLGGTNPDPDPIPVINFATSDIRSFSASQDVVNTTYTYDDTTLTMVGNSWKMLSLDYTVTADTMLTFEFRSGSIGEAQGIGFDTGDQRLIDFYFYLYGTQNGGSVANTDFDYDGSGDWQTFTIPLGDYVSGFVDNLVFLNDDDARSQAESLFRNVSIYEDAVTPPDPDPDPDPEPNPEVEYIDFTASDIGSFSASQDVVNTTFTYDQSTLTMVGNSWKMLSLDYTVTADTMLTFEFRSGSIGEAQGIGFDTGDQRLIDFYFYLYGTQNGGSVREHRLRL